MPKGQKLELDAQFFKSTRNFAKKIVQASIFFWNENPGEKRRIAEAKKVAGEH